MKKPLIFSQKLDPAYKISHLKNTDLGLIKKVAMQNKPVLISTGMTDRKELKTL